MKRFAVPFAVALCALPTMVSAASMPSSSYLTKAGASDLFERQSGQVMSHSRNARVSKFAEMMVRDHTQSTANVKAAAMKAHLRVAPPRLTGEQSRDLTALRRATGTARDRLYIEQQKTAHQQALTVQSNYAADGSVKPLRMVAAKIVPVVKQHIAMLATM